MFQQQKKVLREEIMNGDLKVRKYDNQIVLPKDICTQIEQVAGSTYPNECCGILFGAVESDLDKVEAIEVLDNMSTQSIKDSYYMISPLELFSYEQDYQKQGYEILGFFHSHPDASAILSAEDKAQMVPELFYLIIEVRQGKVTSQSAWRKNKSDDSITEINIT